MRITSDAEAMEAIAYLKSKYSVNAVVKAYSEYNLVAHKEAFELCGDCDGCGWIEGGKHLQTECKTCHGSGIHLRAKGR